MSSRRKPSPEAVLVSRLRLKPGAGEAFRRRAEETLAAAARRPGFVRADLQENRALAGHVVVWETWRGTPEAFLRREMGQPYRRRYEAAVAELALEREIDWLTPVGTWAAARISTRRAASRRSS